MREELEQAVEEEMEEESEAGGAKGIPENGPGVA